jgi:hypothetical protein
METIPGSGTGKPDGKATAASTFLLRHLKGELPERLRPRGHDDRLVAGLLWGDYPLDLREVTTGGRLEIGQDSSAALQVFNDITRRGHVTIVDASPEPARVFLPAAAVAQVRLGGEELTTIDLLERRIGEPCQFPCEGRWIQLGTDDRVVLRFGLVQLVIRYIARRGEKSDRGLDIPFWSRIIIYLMTAATLYRMAAITDYSVLF